MSEEHTPLPWKFSPWHIEEGPSAVRAPAGHLVTTTASDADAKMIVRSVNALPALVKALEETQKVLSVLISPGNERISSMHIWTQAVAAETGARIALASVRDDKP